jgi:hypothetical protein
VSDDSRPCTCRVRVRVPYVVLLVHKELLEQLCDFFLVRVNRRGCVGEEAFTSEASETNETGA